MNLWPKYIWEIFWAMKKRHTRMELRLIAKRQGWTIGKNLRTSVAAKHAEQQLNNARR
jgi:hypothetical protein